MYEDESDDVLTQQRVRPRNPQSESQLARHCLDSRWRVSHDVSYLAWHSSPTPVCSYAEGSIALYNGWEIVKNGQFEVVVVTMQYRLGLFGKRREGASERRLIYKRRFLGRSGNEGQRRCQRGAS